VRTFTLDRIKMLTVTDERFTPPKDFDVENLMRHGFKVIHDELYTVMVKISPDWARWVGKEIWHENQKPRKMGREVWISPKKRLGSMKLTDGY